MTDKPDTHREGTDEALMVRYQRGDRNALAVIVRRYARLIYATACGITGTTDDAAEITQDTFLALVGQAGNFHIEMHFRSWLFGFLHQLITERRDNSVDTGALTVNPTGGVATEEIEPEVAHPASRSARSQLLSRRISECAAALPLREREVLVMKLTAQLTLAELAVATATDGETIRTRLRFALERLRESVSDTEDFARALR